jgi:hypothetical protein
VPTLQAASTNDGPAGTCGHAVPETVVLGPPAGVWLVGPLHFPLVPGSVVAGSIPAQKDFPEGTVCRDTPWCDANATPYATRPVAPLPDNR